jgi:poly-gamma-glutamate synthesis protein (capsule biosynthesis protein)
MASGDDIEQMTAAVRAAAEVADFVAVSIHWGWELETEPRLDDRERAAAMIEAGADMIFGHHPHRLGSLEFIDGKPVFWTLGNFVWPRLSDAGATTAVGRVVISPDGTLDACLIPAFIETSGQPVLTGEPSCGGGS